MDKLTRDLLASLLHMQAALLQSSASTLSLIQQERGSQALRVRAACEGAVLISRLDDPDKRREALDALWEAMDGPPQSTAEKAASKISRDFAALDRRSDIIAKGFSDLISGLQSIPLDGE